MSQAARKSMMNISYIYVCVDYIPLPGDTMGQLVLSRSVILTAWFGLSAPLFTLDQWVHLTAPQGWGGGGCSVQVDSHRGSSMADFMFYVCFSVLFTKCCKLQVHSQYNIPNRFSNN